MINNYGSNAVITDLTSIAFSDIGINSPSAVANDFKLYKRAKNTESNTWNEEDAGDDYNQVEGSISFSTNSNITEFGQFALSNEKAKGWIGVVSTELNNP